MHYRHVLTELDRDKVSIDLVWLRDESLEDLEAALAEFSAVAQSFGESPTTS